MIWVVCRAGAARFDVDGFLEQHPELQPDAIWRVGERMTSKRTRDASGFSLSLAEGEIFGEVLAQTRLATQLLAPVLQELVGLKIDVEIDFGMTVGEEKFFAPSVRFSPETLAWFSGYNLSLVVSAYPCSNEGE